MLTLNSLFSKKDCFNKCWNRHEITGLSFNSKEVKRGEIFIAVKGFSSDGILFAAEAVNNGACAVVCDSKSAVPAETLELLEQKNIPLIKVDNPEAAAAKIARKIFPKQPKTVFAITGTNGKTTIADLTEQLLNLLGFTETAIIGTMGFYSRNSNVRKIEKELNDIIGINPLTTPDTISLHKILDRSYHAGVKYLIIEASSDGIARNRINEIDFTACGLSAIAEDHLITHGTMENYINAKFSLFLRLPAKKTAVYDNDNEHSKNLTNYISKNLPEKKLKLIRYGKTPGNEIQIKEIKQAHQGYDVTVNIFGKEYRAKINLAGEFQVFNVMNALGFILTIIPKKSIPLAVKMLEKLKTVNGRMELVNKTKKGAGVYVDYAHNPAALEFALIELKKITKGKVISVTGISSGKSESRNETARVAGQYADIVIFTYLSPRHETTDEMVAKQQKIFPGGLHGGQTRYDAIKKAIDMAEAADNILINGQGHERFIIEYGKPVPFYDIDAVNEIVGLE